MSAKVLVPLAVLKPEKPEQELGLKSYIRVSYLRKLERYGLTPLLVSPLSKQSVIEEMYEMASGLMLLGGWDIDPKHYNQEPHQKTDLAHPACDEVELSLTRKAFRDYKPILGICRGAQVIAVAAGGSLHQCVEDLEIPESHGNGEGYQYEELVKGPFHEVALSSGTRIAQIIEKERIEINSAHNQAVEEPGEGIVVSGRSPEGVIEIVEHRNPAYFCIGVQNHPEAAEDSALEPIFPAFADAVKDYLKTASNVSSSL